MMNQRKTHKSVQDLLQLLEEECDRLTDSKSYQNYLKTMARFPSYSMRNTLLIYAQCPGATLVAGYSTWKNRFDRHVRKGEKAIRIFAPYSYSKTEPDSRKSETCIGFRAISVFDISQTEGKPLPEPLPIQVLEGDVPYYHHWLEALEKISPYKVIFNRQQDGVRGRCCYHEELIEVDPSLSQLQTIKTLIHEITHALLHAPATRGDSEFEQMLSQMPDLREIEAESCAFCVCSSYGLDCSDYSFPYIAMWRGKKHFFPESLSRIQKMVATIQDKLNENSLIASLYQSESGTVSIDQESGIPAPSIRPLQKRMISTIV